MGFRPVSETPEHREFHQLFHLRGPGETRGASGGIESLLRLLPREHAIQDRFGLTAGSGLGRQVSFDRFKADAHGARFLDRFQLAITAQPRNRGLRATEQCDGLSGSNPLKDPHHSARSCYLFGEQHDLLFKVGELLRGNELDSSWQSIVGNLRGECTGGRLPPRSRSQVVADVTQFGPAKVPRITPPSKPLSRQKFAPC
jgi:hypothetical protein